MDASERQLQKGSLGREGNPVAIESQRSAIREENTRWLQDHGRASGGRDQDL
jgi:hypothetical protein